MTNVNLEALFGDIMLTRIILHPLLHVRLILAELLGNVGADVAEFFFDCLLIKLNLKKLLKIISDLGNFHTLLGWNARLALFE